MRIAIYARVSKEEGSQNSQDPLNQLKPLREFCAAMGWVIAAEFVDYASGGDSNRPQFKTMLGRVRQRHFDLVLVWALDRFSREGMTNTLSYMKQLHDYKTTFKSLQEPWLDTSNEGIGQVILAVFSWVAEQEKKRISERTKAALARKKALGVKLGRPPKCVMCGFMHHKRKQCKRPPASLGVIYETV
jgi:DNA invertase Pin-like site-specific DNA recombinase